MLADAGSIPADSTIYKASDDFCLRPFGLHSDQALPRRAAWPSGQPGKNSRGPTLGYTSDRGYESSHASTATLAGLGFKVQWNGKPGEGSWR